MSNFSYGPSYSKLIEALQSGGPNASRALKLANETRGLAMQPKADSESEGASISARILERMRRVQKDNEARKVSYTSQDADVSTTTSDGPPLEDPSVTTIGSVVDFIINQEGFREQAYDDQGRYSIGYGTKGKKGQTITEEEARKELLKEVTKARTIVLKAKQEFGYDWSENQIDALTSFTYNAGQGNFRKLLTGDSGDDIRGDEEISEMILEYNRAGGKVLEGLTKRRQAEADLFTQGY